MSKERFEEIQTQIDNLIKEQDEILEKMNTNEALELFLKRSNNCSLEARSGDSSLRATFKPLR